TTLIADPSPAVRRECALAVRLLKDKRKAELWGKLAVQHDGYDRWYLEALGIGAANDWDACLKAALNDAGNPSDSELAGSPVARDVFWRSRASNTPELLAMLLTSPDISAKDAPRYMRAFDFQSSPSKESVLEKLAFGKLSDQAKSSYVTLEAFSRLPA